MHFPSIGLYRFLKNLVTELYLKSLYPKIMNKTITKSDTKESLFLIGEHLNELEPKKFRILRFILGAYNINYL